MSEFLSSAPSVEPREASDTLSETAWSELEMLRLKNAELEGALAHCQHALAQKEAALAESEDRYLRSEAKFNDILNHEIASITSFRLFADRTWAYNYFSAGCARMFGYTAQEFLADQQLWISRVHPDDVAMVIVPAWEDIVAERSGRQEYRFNHKDGSLRWISTVFTAYRDKVANCWVVTTVDMDITDRKQMELNLQESELRLHTIVRNSLDGLLIVDSTGMVQFANPAAACVFGKSPEELIGHNFGFPIGQAGTALNVEFVRDEQVCFGEMSVAKASWGGELVNIVSLRDVSDRQQAEIALRQQQQAYQMLVKNSPDIIERFDLNFKRLYVSPSLEKLAGISAENFLGKSCRELHLPEPMLSTWEAAVQILLATGEKQAVEVETATLLGDRTFEMLLAPELDENHEINSILCISRDITDRKQTEEALRISQARFAGILEIASDAIISIDANQRITLFNRGAENIFGYRAEEMLGQPLDRLLPDRFATAHHHHIHNFSQSAGQTRRMGDRSEIFARRKDGTEFPAEASIAKLQLGDEVIFTAFLQDITARKTAELALQELNCNLEAKVQERTVQLQLALTTAHMGYWESDLATKGQYWSPENYTLLGYQYGESGAVLDQSGQILSPVPTYELFWATVHPDDRAYMLQIRQAAMMLDRTYIVEHRVIWPDGSIRWRYTRGGCIFNEQGQPVKLIGVSIDITDRKQTELRLQKQVQSEQLLATIAQTINQSARLEEVLADVLERIRDFLAVDRVLVYRFQADWNGVIELEAVSQPDFVLLGQTIQDPCFGRDQAERYRQGYVSVVNDIYDQQINPCHAQLLDQFQVRANIAVPIFQAEQIWGLLIAHQCHQPREWRNSEIDLLKQLGLHIGTAGQKANLYHQLGEQLSQREVLLKEIHHRVKNNLQIISSLMRMQARQVKEESTAMLFQEAHQRVLSMALIHEQLYQSTNFSQIEFGGYLKSLVSNLFMTYGIAQSRIAYTISTNGLTLDLNTAIPCGLIVNELVSNALKYAFPDGRSGSLTIQLEVSQSQAGDDQLILSVSDNGIGIPENLDWEKATSLGLKIVRSLTTQLRGALELDRRDGTTFRIIFPLKQPFS